MESFTKRIGLLFFCLLMVASLFGQTQHGIVKTKGRMVNGRLIPGKGLKNAIVSCQGQTSVISESDGSFTIPVRGQYFLIESVKKKGFQLVDADAAPKTYTCSSSPLYMLMETPEQQMEDLLETKERIRKTLDEQLQIAQAEIKRLHKEKKLSEEEYSQRLQELINNHETNWQLIPDMAKQYSSIDFDHLDSLKGQISNAISNGDLTKADSLIRTKGDIHTRTAELLSLRIANEKGEQELSQSKALAIQKCDDIADDCMSRHDIFKLSLQFDSAAYYIKYRAELDTTNTDWQLDAAGFCHHQHDFKEAERFYLRALGNIKEHNQISDNEYLSVEAIIETDLAMLYSRYDRPYECDSLYRSSLSKWNILAKSNPGLYELQVAWVSGNFGALCCENKRYDESEKLFMTANDIYKQYYKQGDNYEASYAWTTIWLAVLYSETQRYDESETKYKEALKIRQHLASVNSQLYDDDLANVLTEMGKFYYQRERFVESDTYFNKAIKIYRRLAKSNPQVFKESLALALGSFASLYFSQDTSKKEEMLLEALSLYQSLSEQYPNVYNKFIAWINNCLGNLYASTNNYIESENAYMDALDFYSKRIQEGFKKYEPNIAYTLKNLAQLYQTTNRYKESDSLYQKSLMIYKRLAEKNPIAYESNVMDTYYKLAGFYNIIQSRDRADSTYNKVVERYTELAINNPKVYGPYVADAIYYLANYYYNTQRMTDAENAYLKALKSYSHLSEVDLKSKAPKMAVAADILGVIYIQRREIDQFLKVIKEMEILNKYIEETPIGADVMDRIGNTFFNAYKYDTALDYYQKAFQIRIKLLGENNEKTATAIHHMANTFVQMRDFAQAVIYYQQAIDIREKVLGKKHPNLATTFDGVGNIYLELKDYPKAKEYYQKSFNIRTSVLGHEHLDTAWSYYNLACSYLGLGKIEKALQYLQEALEIRAALLGDNHPLTNQIRRMIQSQSLQ